MGCAPTPNGALVPMGHAAFSQVFACLPELGALPLHYELKCFETPLDSSDMGPKDWVLMACAILDVYEQFDGFVVLHGTDTLAWSASALSFLLQGLSKTCRRNGFSTPFGLP